MEPAIQDQRRIFWREFFWLWTIAAVLGALSLLLVHFPLAGLARQLFIPFHSESTALMLVAVTAQNSFELAISIGVGLWAAHRVGLGAPVLEAWLRNESVRPYLRAPIVPILLTAVLFVVCSTLANSSVFHPNRKQDAAAANELLNSPVMAKVGEQIDRIGLGGSGSISPVSEIISSLASAISGELTAQLFEVSVVILLLAQLFGKPNRVPEQKFFLAAILLVVLMHTALYLLMEHKNTLVISEIFKRAGLPFRVGPIWLSAAQISVSKFPTGFALGWLYVSYGIETSIVASFGAAILNHAFTILRLSHFT